MCNDKFWLAYLTLVLFLVENSIKLPPPPPPPTGNLSFVYGVIFNFGTKEHIYAFLESTKASVFNSDNLFMILITFQNLWSRWSISGLRKKAKEKKVLSFSGCSSRSFWCCSTGIFQSLPDDNLHFALKCIVQLLWPRVHLDPFKQWITQPDFVRINILFYVCSHWGDIRQEQTKKTKKQKQQPNI